MSRPTFARTSSNARVHSKGAKPSPLKATINSHKRHSSTSSKSSKNKRDSHVQLDDDDDAMTALPSFCTTCEKQIIHPSGTFLYCSDACRRRDSTSTGALETAFDAASLAGSSDDLDEPYMPDIVPQRSPTTIRPASIASSDSIYDRPRSRHESDAGKYLAQFLTSGSTSPSRRPRPGYYRNPTTTSNMTIPSLSNTPGSFGSLSSSYGSVARTAPSRLPPWAQQSSSIVNINSSNLASASVHSSSSTATAFQTPDTGSSEDSGMYMKKPVPSTSVPQTGSLKQLFAHEAMRRPSTLAYNKSSSSLCRQIEVEDD